jgi:hypothetical protein
MKLRRFAFLAAALSALCTLGIVGIGYAIADDRICVVVGETETCDEVTPPTTETVTVPGLTTVTMPLPTAVTATLPDGQTTVIEAPPIDTTITVVSR